ncbi:AAC(3)-I family aminoglycoside N-acetyltransferase [Variovorax sp. JS1663]|uniref:AAC(3)-I family aminoglycoside N-acetyltransferase n=1 Tax=Variovorax sp. JS1663 TaxID=1851577 RepID=UPI000B348367|nr:AAC(3)-I family aminoglycoside N-acetyltransferase [Variovorax sp. JS1663]OUL99803.1 AAC(3)-I family aminoglycoside 3-N-acetyltransferase [Variovorax sp. JS1663]
MSSTTGYTIHQLSADDTAQMNALLSVFGEAFDDADSYGAKRPSPAYLRQLLGGDAFIALVARDGVQVVGGLAAYVLRKFEQERSEIYIYDLAVAAPHRRRGLATGLIRALQRIGAERGAYVIFVQADPPDAPAIALYAKLGVREDVLHFDIPVRPAPAA